MNQFLALIALLTLMGCGASHSLFVSDLNDHGDALTNQGGDALFGIYVLEIEEPLRLVDLTLEVRAQGGTYQEVELELATDTNDDGMLGVGDTLVGREGATETYGPDEVGALFDVRLQTRIIGHDELEELLLAQWVGDGGLG